MRPSDWSLIREIKVKGNDSSTSPWGLQLCFLTSSSLLSHRGCANPETLFSHWPTVPPALEGGTTPDSQSVRWGWGERQGLHAVLGDPLYPTGVAFRASRSETILCILSFHLGVWALNYVEAPGSQPGNVSC